MKGYINTRSIMKDYCYLAIQPNTSWLVSFKDYTSFEEPTILVEKNKSNLRLYLGNMPSNRKDKAERIIRYTFVFETDKNETNINQVGDLVNHWIKAINSNENKQVLAGKLDKLLPEDEVANFISGTVENAEQILQDKLNDWLKANFNFSDQEVMPSTLELDKDTYYTDALANADKHFIPTVYHLLTDKNISDISLFYLNFIETQTEFKKSDLSKVDNGFIILIEKGEFKKFEKKRSMQEEVALPKKNQVAMKPQNQGILQSNTKKILIVIVAILAIIAVSLLVRLQ